MVILHCPHLGKLRPRHGSLAAISSSAIWKSHEPDGSPLTIEDIIGATGDSPLTYLQKLRIAAAKRLLESDHRSMQEISDAVGYQDVVFFRQLFQRHTGVSPSAYRRRFGLNGDKAA